MKKLLAFIFVVVIGYNLYSQTCVENINRVLFHYVSILDTAYEEMDSIRFVISPYKAENPTVIFSAGSGNRPLFFVVDGDTNAYINLPFSVYEYLKDFNFVYISKPGIPLCAEWTENPPLIDTTFPNVMTFYKMDFLDYYVNQLNQVVDYLKKLSESPIYLIGGSQGGRVISKYASVYQNKVQKIVPFSSGILDRYYEEILYWRQLSDLKQISQEEAQQNIDEVYKRYLSGRDYYNYFEQNPNAESSFPFQEHHSILTNYSYNFEEISLNYLLKIDIPILCVYGTSDIKSIDNDMLPLFFARANKNNLTMLPKLYCDHSFFERKHNPKTGEMEEKYIANEVFKEIFLWLRESN